MSGPAAELSFALHLLAAQLSDVVFDQDHYRVALSAYCPMIPSTTRHWRSPPTRCVIARCWPYVVSLAQSRPEVLEVARCHGKIMDEITVDDVNEAAKVFQPANVTVVILRPAAPKP
jgi:hypothetical protein